MENLKSYANAELVSIPAIAYGMYILVIYFIMKFRSLHSKLFIAFTFFSLVLCAGLYITFQHVLRAEVNDPQISYAEEIAAHLNAGAAPQEQVGNTAIDISKSLSPFVVLTHKDGKPFISSGILNGTVPLIPTGSLAAADSKGENKITWEPAQGIRIATIIVPFNAGTASSSGYVLVGRSMREQETLDRSVLSFAFGIWVVSSIIVGFLLWFLEI